MGSSSSHHTRRANRAGGAGRGATALCLALLLATAAGVPPATAAPATNSSAAESAGVARAAWRTGIQALQSGDSVTARREVARAAAAWPTQDTYVWGRAVLAAPAGDTATVLAALTALADLGLGRDVRAHRVVGPYASIPAFAAVIARLDAQRAPLARSTVRATMTDSTFWPEGVGYDPRTRRFYIGSVRHGSIVAIPADGSAARDLLPPGQAGIGSILGVHVDAARDLLYATTAGLPQRAGFTSADTAIAALLRIRLADGVVERRWDLPPVAGGHVLGDVVTGPAGDVYTTDSAEPVLYRLRPGADTLEAMRHSLFRSLQGIAPSPDGRAVYVADWSHGLLRVDFATGEVIRLADAPGSTSLGCDGIAWHRGALVAVQNGVAPPRIMRFRLTPDGLRIARAEVLDRNTAIADEPTIGVVVGDDFVYVANSQWEKYTDDGARRPGRALTAPVLLAVPLDR